VSSRKNQDGNISSRRSPRYAQFSDLSLTYEGRTEEISSRPPDISPHGMFINTARRFPEGAVMKLRFRLSRSGIEVHARGEVRYCLAGVGIGVEFIGLKPEYVRAIEEEIAGTPVIG
jgi:PilZ domain-containing protein